MSVRFDPAPHIAEATVAAAHRYGPTRNRLAALLILDYAQTFYALKCLGKRRGGIAHEKNGAASEKFRVPQRIRAPQVILAPAIAERKAERVNRWMALTVEAEFTR